MTEYVPKIVLTKKSEGEKLGGWSRSTEKRKENETLEGGTNQEKAVKSKKGRYKAWKWQTLHSLKPKYEIRKESPSRRAAVAKTRRHSGLSEMLKWLRTYPGSQLVFRWSYRNQEKTAGGCMTLGRMQTQAVICHMKGNGWCRDAEYEFALVTGGKSYEEKGRADS